jgi:uncharacterized protein (DUF111 family)
MTRTILTRNALSLDSPYGKIEIKETILPDGNTSQKIEFDSIRKLAQLHNLEIMEMHNKLNNWLVLHQNSKES